ncbi:unnamed protein product [Schistosoma curassoni]|uniref:Uncharacterized protein n=1 Tax=Schistosoma curassoni TaxID=6186 RepID=A0A183KDA5_9TREM|nr:unnamed protein product [Schistosoma curassoni]
MFVCFDLQQSLLPMKNKNQTTIRLSEQISGYMIDEISSESSEGGRRFLRNPEKRINKNVGSCHLERYALQLSRGVESQLTMNTATEKYVPIKSEGVIEPSLFDWRSCGIERIPKPCQEMVQAEAAEGIRKQSPATTEDENTEDLLTPFSAGKTSIDFNKYSTQRVFNSKVSSYLCLLKTHFT